MITPQAPPRFLNDEQPSRDVASFQEMSIAKEIILSGFNDGLDRRILYGQVENVVEIKNFFLTLWFEERLYTFFIPETLKGISERVFTHPTVRDFVLDWTDATAILLSVHDYSIDRLIKSISKGISLNKAVSTVSTTGVENEDNDGSLINVRLRMTMHIEEDIVQSILQKNFWLVCIIVLYLYMSELVADKTSHFAR